MRFTIERMRTLVLAAGVLLVVALVVVGPKDLPRLMRTLGGWVRKARGMADQFRASFDEMTRETELEELRAEIDALRHARPLGNLEDEVNRALLPKDAEAAEQPAKADAPAPAPETPEEAAKPAPQSEPPAS